MPVQIEKRRLLLQYCAKAAALFRYDLDKTKSPVSSYSDAICFCANTLTYGDFIRESGSDPSKPHGKLVLHPDYFQVLFRFHAIYTCTVLLLSDVFRFTVVLTLLLSDSFGKSFVETKHSNAKKAHILQ